MFWRRGGSRFDNDNGPLLGWGLRILVFVLVAAAAMLAIRVALPRAEASDLPYAGDAGWKGEKVCELLFENDETRVARCTFPPGVGHERH
ncbi:MAG: hypothetical protein R3C58_15900, partial [Parvularculaceae bacterium]